MVLIRTKSKIERLAERVQKRGEQREMVEEAEKKRTARDREIDKAPSILRTTFYCGRCDRDFDANGYKCVRDDWTVKGQRLAFYKGQCPCGNWRQRRITDREGDPYFKESSMVKKQRKMHATDMLQPGQFGFKTKYGDPFKKQNVEREAQERVSWKKKMQINF